jgi:hypothetical protein
MSIVRQHRKLSVDHPAEFERAVAPFTELLQTEVANAVRAGVAGPCDVARTSAIIFGLLVDGLADIAVTGNDARDVTTSLWPFIAGGLRVDIDAPRMPSPREEVLPAATAQLRSPCHDVSGALRHPQIFTSEGDHFHLAEDPLIAYAWPCSWGSRTA